MVADSGLAIGRFDALNGDAQALACAGPGTVLIWWLCDALRVDTVRPGGSRRYLRDG